MKNATKPFWALCVLIFAACFITGCPDPHWNRDKCAPPTKTEYDIGDTLDLAGSTITSIGEDAFSLCPSLTSVTIPNSVTFALNNSCAYI